MNLRWSELYVWNEGSVVKQGRSIYKGQGSIIAAEPNNPDHVRFYVKTQNMIYVNFMGCLRNFSDTFERSDAFIEWNVLDASEFDILSIFDVGSFNRMATYHDAGFAYVCQLFDAVQVVQR